ncbi:MAG: exosome complex RNA-binding protein Csl4 [Desulfurococcaceae archaeon]
MSFVVPGDIIGVEEEAIPLHGVYVDRAGFIRALTAGVAVVDKYRKTAYVKPFNRRELLLRHNSLVEGVVVSVSEDNALVRIYSSGGSKVDAIGLLHISQISNEYVPDIYGFIRPSDVLKARLLNSTPPYILSTKEPSAGVIFASCSSCGYPLYLSKQGILVCRNCGNHEKRKLAVGYVLVMR